MTEYLTTLAALLALPAGGAALVRFARRDAFAGPGLRSDEPGPLLGDPGSSSAWGALRHRRR